MRYLFIVVGMVGAMVGAMTIHHSHADTESVPLSFFFEGIGTGGGLFYGTLPEHHGLRTQGGLKKVICSRHFFLALPALAKGEVAVSVKDDRGRISSWQIAVPSRLYQETHISGLPETQVSPDELALKRIAEERHAMRSPREEVDCETIPQLPLTLPVEGRISGVFGSRRVLNGQPRSRHLGLDIAAPTGTRVIAAEKGSVVFAQKNLFFTGHTIILNHGMGLFTLYAHLSDIHVMKGDAVARGDAIGAVGATGRVTGAHLHWAVYLNTTAIDPALITELSQSHHEAAILPSQELPRWKKYNLIP